MRKKILSVLLIVIILCTMMPTFSFAESQTVEVPPADEIIEGADYAEAMALTRSGLNGSGSITKLSATSALCKGKTTTSSSNVRLTIVIEIQQYKNGEWRSYNTASKTGSGTSVELSKKFTVIDGYYYRVKLTHRASGETTKYSYSKGIFF